MKFVERYLNRHIIFEIAPGIISPFFNYGWVLMWATAVVMVATVVFTFLGITIEQRVSVFPIVTILLALTLAAATLFFVDEAFIKIKTTVGQCSFSTILIIGLFLRPSLFARALGPGLFNVKRMEGLYDPMSAVALVLAAMNEYIRLTIYTDTRTTFKASTILCNFL